MHHFENIKHVCYVYSMSCLIIYVYCSMTTGDSIRPRPWISMMHLSPGWRNLGGFRCIPTPPGVPLKITSPSFNVQIWLIQLIINLKSSIKKTTLWLAYLTGMSKMRNFVLLSCIRSSFIQDLEVIYKNILSPIRRPLRGLLFHISRPLRGLLIGPLRGPY